MKTFKQFQIDELSRKTLGNYVQKANKSRIHNDNEAASADWNDNTKKQLKHLKKVDKRDKGITRAADKLVKKEETQPNMQVYMDAICRDVSPAKFHQEAAKRKLDATQLKPKNKIEKKSVKGYKPKPRKQDPGANSDQKIKGILKSWGNFPEAAQSASASEMKPKKKPDEGAEFEPVSKGEQDFKKAHTDKSTTQDYPVKVDNQFGADKDQDHDDHKADGAKDEKGEKTPVKPKTADVPEDDKDGSKKRDPSKASGKDNGEKSSPKQGSSDADKETKIREELDPQMQVYMNDITMRES